MIPAVVFHSIIVVSLPCTASHFCSWQPVTTRSEATEPVIAILSPAVILLEPSRPKNYCRLMHQSITKQPFIIINKNQKT